MDSLPGVTPARLAGRFFLYVSLLFLLWSQTAGLYTATLLPPANWLLHAGGTPASLARDSEAVVLGLHRLDGPWRILQVKGYDLVCLNSIAAIALFLAIPGLPTRKRATWCIATAALLWLTHVGTLYAGTCEAVGTYLRALPLESRFAVDPGWQPLTADKAAGVSRLIGTWSVWGSPALILIAWTLALPRQFWRNA